MNKYYLYEDIKQDRNVKYDKPKREKTNERMEQTPRKQEKRKNRRNI